MSGADGMGGNGSPQDRYYQRYSATTGPIGNEPGAPRKGNTRWVVLGAAIIAVIVAIVAVVVSGVGRSTGAAGRSSTASSQSTSLTSSTSSTSPTSTISGAVSVRTTVPGWQAVGGLVNSSLIIKAAYDAPPTWTVKQDSFITFENEKGSGLSGKHTDWGLAAVGIGKCAGHPNATQASASFIDIGKRDPAEAINSVVTDFGAASSLNKDKTSHAKQGDLTSKSITLASGTPAVRGDLTVDQGTLNDDCGTGKPMAFHAVAFSANGRSVLLLIVVAEWPGQPTPTAATTDKIISTFRPAGA